MAEVDEVVAGLGRFARDRVFARRASMLRSIVQSENEQRMIRESTLRDLFDARSAGMSEATRSWARGALARPLREMQAHEVAGLVDAMRETYTDPNDFVRDVASYTIRNERRAYEYAQGDVVSAIIAAGDASDDVAQAAESLAAGTTGDVVNIYANAPRIRFGELTPAQRLARSQRFADRNRDVVEPTVTRLSSTYWANAGERIDAMQREMRERIQRGEGVVRAAEAMISASDPVVRVPRYMEDLLEAANTADPGALRKAIRRHRSQMRRLGMAGGTQTPRGPFTIRQNVEQFVLDARNATAADVARSFEYWAVARANYQARVVVRTEASRAFNEVYREKQLAEPFVRGVRWNLSFSHPAGDVCDMYAGADHGMGPGVYDERDTAIAPPAHPNCMCYWSSEIDRDWAHRRAVEVRMARVDAGEVTPLQRAAYGPEVDRLMAAGVGEREAWLRATDPRGLIAAQEARDNRGTVFDFLRGDYSGAANRVGLGVQEAVGARRWGFHGWLYDNPEMRAPVLGKRVAELWTGGAEEIRSTLASGGSLASVSDVIANMERVVSPTGQVAPLWRVLGAPKPTRRLGRALAMRGRSARIDRLLGFVDDVPPPPAPGTPAAPVPPPPGPSLPPAQRLFEAGQHPPMGATGRLLSDADAEILERAWADNARIDALIASGDQSVERFNALTRRISGELYPSSDLDRIIDPDGGWLARLAVDDVRLANHVDGLRQTLQRAVAAGIEPGDLVRDLVQLGRLGDELHNVGGDVVWRYYFTAAESYGANPHGFVDLVTERNAWIRSWARASHDGNAAGANWLLGGRPLPIDAASTKGDRWLALRSEIRVRRVMERTGLDRDLVRRIVEDVDPNAPGFDEVWQIAEQVEREIITNNLPGTNPITDQDWAAFALGERWREQSAFQYAATQSELRRWNTTAAVRERIESTSITSGPARQQSQALLERARAVEANGGTPAPLRVYRGIDSRQGNALMREGGLARRIHEATDEQIAEGLDFEFDVRAASSWSTSPADALDFAAGSQQVRRITPDGQAGSWSFRFRGMLDEAEILSDWRVDYGLAEIPEHEILALSSDARAFRARIEPRFVHSVDIMPAMGAARLEPLDDVIDALADSVDTDIAAGPRIRSEIRTRIEDLRMWVRHRIRDTGESVPDAIEAFRAAAASDPELSTTMRWFGPDASFGSGRLGEPTTHFELRGRIVRPPETD